VPVRSPVSHDDAPSSAVYRGRVLLATTSTFASNAIGVGLALLVLSLLWRSILRSPRLDHVCWPDFERQFAEYVASRAEGAHAQTRDGRDGAGERPPEQDAPSARRPD
jgi:hypothetical protein